MESITFTFDEQTTDADRRRVLEEIRQWSDVIKAAHLKKNAKNPLVARMAYATVSNDADADAIVKKLNDLQEVKSAGRPAQRFAINTR